MSALSAVQYSRVFQSCQLSSILVGFLLSEEVIYESQTDSSAAWGGGGGRGRGEGEGGVTEYSR
jgi:hypothetical protein